MQTSAAKLFAISSTTSRTWLLNPALGRCVFSDYLREQSTLFFQDSQLFYRVLRRFHPTNRQTAIFLTMVPAYQFSILEFSGLEGTNLIDFPPSQSPDSKRSFWSVSVLTSSQLALDMSVSSAVWSCLSCGVSVSHWWDSAHNSFCVVSSGARFGLVSAVWPRATETGTIKKCYFK